MVKKNLNVKNRFLCIKARFSTKKKKTYYAVKVNVFC